MGRQKRKFATWSTNLQNPGPNLRVLKKKKTGAECSGSEGSEDKENIPELAEGSYSGSAHQTRTPNQRRIQTLFECAEGTSIPFNLLLSESLPSTPQRAGLRETSQAGMGPSSGNEPETIETLGNQTSELAVSNR